MHFSSCKKFPIADLYKACFSLLDAINDIQNTDIPWLYKNMPFIHIANEYRVNYDDDTTEIQVKEHQR